MNEDPVFSRAPQRNTFAVDRENAGIVRETADGGFSYHSLRKWLSCELDRTGATPAVRYKLMRHSGSITDDRYTTTDVETESLAVQRLARLWPDALPLPERFSVQSARKSLTRVVDIADNAGAMSNTTRHNDRTPGRPDQSETGPGGLGFSGSANGNRAESCTVPMIESGHNEASEACKRRQNSQTGERPSERRDARDRGQEKVGVTAGETVWGRSSIGERPYADRALAREDGSGSIPLAPVHESPSLSPAPSPSNQVGGVSCSAGDSGLSAGGAITRPDEPIPAQTGAGRWPVRGDDESPRMVEGHRLTPSQRDRILSIIERLLAPALVAAAITLVSVESHPIVGFLDYPTGF